MKNNISINNSIIKGDIINGNVIGNNSNILKKDNTGIKTLAKVIVGSTSQGLNTPESDVDIMEVIKYPLDDYLYKVNTIITKDNNNTNLYEIGEFLNLLKKGNPTMLSLIFTDDEFIKETSPEFEQIRNIRNIFLTKKIKNNFIGFIKSQVDKSYGAERKMNWSKERVKRKTILDFCFVKLQKESTVPLKKWLEIKNLTQNEICVAKINHSLDGYNIYLQNGGLYDELSDSNQLKTPNIIEDLLPIGELFYNGNAYSEHCKDYREYQEFEKNCNKSRYVTGIDGKMFNGKNLMHAVRLLNMAQELVMYGKFIVNRKHKIFGKTVEELLEIRKGNVEPMKLLNWIDEQLIELKELYNECNLPDDVNEELIKELTIKFRK